MRHARTSRHDERDLNYQDEVANQIKDLSNEFDEKAQSYLKLISRRLDDLRSQAGEKWEETRDMLDSDMRRRPYAYVAGAAFIGTVLGIALFSSFSRNNKRFE